MDNKQKDSKTKIDKKKWIFIIVCAVVFIGVMISYVWKGGKYEEAYERPKEEAGKNPDANQNANTTNDISYTGGVSFNIKLEDFVSQYNKMVRKLTESENKGVEYTDAYVKLEAIKSEDFIERDSGVEGVKEYCYVFTTLGQGTSAAIDIFADNDSEKIIGVTLYVSSSLFDSDNQKTSYHWSYFVPSCVFVQLDDTVFDTMGTGGLTYKNNIVYLYGRNNDGIYRLTMFACKKDSQAYKLMMGQ